MMSKATPLGNGLMAKSNPPPNQTLYLTNLPEKLQKTDLRLSLYTLFSTYGPIIDVVALKSGKMRGQAHIAFRDVQASTHAMRALQGFNFFGKEMKVQFAKGKSDAIAKLDGTYKLPVAASTEVTSTALQQSIFGAPPNSLSVPVTTQPPSAKLPGTVRDGEMYFDSGNGDPKGVKRARIDESDDEGAPMEEDSDAPMEASSSDDD